MPLAAGGIAQGFQQLRQQTDKALQLHNLGCEVRLMPANYVKPYVKRGKTDAVDAEVICEAVRRPAMRFVEIKTEGQQAMLAIHRARDLVVRQRT